MDKYKLINNNTKEETICDKVTIDAFDYYVSNEKTLSKNGDYYLGHPNYDTLFKWGMFGIHEGKQVWINKVIATNNSNIDIPKVVDEIERLSEELSKEYSVYETAQDDVYQGIMTGYNKSQESHPFSEKNMIEFADWKDDNFYQHITDMLYRPMQGRLMYKIIENKSYSTKELLQLWKEQQPKVIYYNG